jgi:hypothetical protein
VPQNRNVGSVSHASFTTGVFGQPDKLQTLIRVNPIYSTRPNTVANASLQVSGSQTPGSLAIKGTVTMNANWRFDTLSTPGVTDNFFQFKHDVTLSYEVIDLVPQFVPAGSR